jgi:hypothetical protein
MNETGVYNAEVVPEFQRQTRSERALLYMIEAFCLQKYE